MWYVGEYGIIDEPTRLVDTESMSDPDGRTRMAMTHAGIPADSPGAMGWNMALDKLEVHLVA